MRSKLFLKSSLITFFSKLFCHLVDFICRTVLIYTLPQEYVGVNGLLSSALAVLSLSELGFGTVLVYSMYVPFAQKDEEKLLALTDFYKKAYHIIAALVGLLGICLAPFLPYIVNDCPDIPGLSVFYLLYMANMICSYAFTYHQSLFHVDQRPYIITFYYHLLRIVRTVLQIVILITTRNFFLYLFVMIPFTLFTNLLLSWKAKKEYPFLNSDRHPKLAADEKKNIFKNVYAMFNHRVSSTILNSTDNLLISFFLGLTTVARNDSYNMILNFVRSMLTSFFAPLNASVGNYYALNTEEETHSLFETLHFATLWLYTFCTASFFLLVNPAITFVWGEEFLLSFPAVLLISVNFYIMGIRQMPNTFKEAMGFLYQDRYIPIVEAFANLALSILLGKFIGIVGIFVGTFISVVFTSFWVEPYILMRDGFHRSTKVFWLKNIRYLLTSTLAIALTWLCCLPFELPLLALIGVRIVLCLTIPNIIFLLFFFKTPEFRMLRDLLMQSLQKSGS
ncbi:MAG: hypothetical protein K2M42_04200 [Oscillospiraceae bacterium]|nr:hypothetical protein [Oscillospiraceae bacterium]